MTNLIKTTLGYHLPDGGNSTYVHVGEAPGEKTAFAQAVKALKLDMLKQDPEMAEYVLDLKPWAESYERNVPAEVSVLDALLAEIKAALEGDSNDAEHDALVSCAQYFELDYTPYDDLDDEEEA